MFIVATSKNQDPSDFVSNFIDSININDGYEIALTAMFHGPLYNIDERHNRFTLTSNEYEAMEYRIPPNFYESTVELLLAIQNTLLNDMKTSGSILKVAPTVKVDVNGVFNMVLNKEKGKDDHVRFIVDRVSSGETGLLQHFGYYIPAHLIKLRVVHQEMGTTTEPTFIYSNVVGESTVDTNQSRLLACAPLKTEGGYSFHEFQNPHYHPLRVNSFTDISFQLRNVRGDLIQIAHEEKHDAQLSLFSSSNITNVFERYPTIMILHVRQRS